jgi:hypothetical protein
LTLRTRSHSVWTSGKREAVADREVILVRFPDGGAELYWGSSVPSVGDQLTRNGWRWIVARVGRDPAGAQAITLMPAEVERDEGWPSTFDFISAYVPGLEAPTDPARHYAMQRGSRLPVPPRDVRATRAAVTP